MIPIWIYFRIPLIINNITKIANESGAHFDYLF